MKDERAWADFFMTVIGLAIFAALMLIAVSNIIAYKKPTKEVCETADIVKRKIEGVAMAPVAINKSYTFSDFEREMEEQADVKILSMEISSGFVEITANINGKEEPPCTRPILIKIYPDYWKGDESLREYLRKDICPGRDGTKDRYLFKDCWEYKFSKDLGSIKSFEPYINKSLVIEKTGYVYYEGSGGIEKEDYVLVYQR